MAINDDRSWRASYRLVGQPLYDTGSSLVQKARRLSDGTIVVLKIARGEEHRSRFEREIEVGMHLAHRNVMPILDADVDDLWFAMPLASGNGLVPDPKIADEKLFVAISQVCRGLQAGHDEGYVHRDVKPENILQLDDAIVVADWGLARNPTGTTRSGKPTQTGLRYGSWGWAAPELDDGSAHEATAAADVYSVGQIIGWMLTATRPVQNVALVPDGTVWAEVVTSCTAFESRERPQSMDELLQQILDTLALPDSVVSLAGLRDPAQGINRSSIVRPSQVRDESASRSTDYSLQGFFDRVASGEPCAELFAYRNVVRRQDQTTAEAMNSELRRIGCMSSGSARRDLSREPSGAEHPSLACERAYAAESGVAVDFTSAEQWSPMAVDGDRRILSRLADNDFSNITLCDVVVEGDYSSPTSVTVHSVFSMATVGDAPNEEAPPIARMWEEADARR